MKNNNTMKWLSYNKYLTDYNYNAENSFTNNHYKLMKHMISFIKKLHEQGKITEEDLSQLIFYTVSIFADNQVKNKIDDFYGKAVNKYFFRNNELYDNKRKEY
ncbi:MAG: hypothetical protein WDA74_05510 [Spirochaetota bacterium]